jgi:E3 ubiquitin-protein ligase DOA10
MGTHLPSHAKISGNDAVDQTAKDALTEKIDNRETNSPQDLIKWMKKEVAMNRQHIWERGNREMKNRKTSASWQNDTTELNRKEQMIISRLKTG